MDTLSNVRIAEKDSCCRLTPAAIPKAENKHAGVSVAYAPDPTKSWFVLRASYGRENLAANDMIGAGYYVYVPRHYQWKDVDGHPKRVLKNMIPNILFAYISAHDADTLIRNADPAYPSPCPRLSPILSYYYDHFAESPTGKNPPLTIPPSEMLNFIEMTKTQDENLLLVQNPDLIHFKSDDEVEVTEGMFKGVRGRVARVAGQQRVVIQLSSFGYFTTAYVSSAFLRKI